MFANDSILRPISVCSSCIVLGKNCLHQISFHPYSYNDPTHSRKMSNPRIPRLVAVSLRNVSDCGVCNPDNCHQWYGPLEVNPLLKSESYADRFSVFERFSYASFISWNFHLLTFLSPFHRRKSPYPDGTVYTIPYILFLISFAVASRATPRTE